MATVLDLALKLHMHPESVRRLCRQEKIPSHNNGRWKINLKIDSEKLVTVFWLSQALEKSPWTIYSMIKNGSLTAQKINGRWYICKEEALKLLHIRM